MIAFAFHPIDYKQPRILILEVLAIGPQRVDAKNATLANRASYGEAAAKIAHIFNEGSLRDLASLTVSFGDLNRNIHQDAPFRPMFDHMQI
jgi:hypothetical protein